MKAFPEYNDNQQGMDLRDYFAAKAMQGIMANRETYLAMVMDNKTGTPHELYISIQCYKQADAMIKARKQ